MAKLARYRRRYQKERLRELLATPIRAYKFSPALSAKDRANFISKRLARRTEALFALYEIPEDFSLLDQWEMLARAIATEHFTGYRVLEKGLGGSGEDYREKQRELFRRFQGFQQHHSRSAAAVNFIRIHRSECEAAGFTKPKSFAETAARFYKRIDVDPLGSKMLPRAKPGERPAKKTP